MVPIGEVLTLTDMVCRFYRGVEDRFAKASSNPQVAKDLGRRFSNVRTRTLHLGIACKENKMDLSEVSLADLRHRIQSLRHDIDQIHAELKEMDLKIRKRHIRIGRAKRMASWLSGQEMLATEIERGLSEISTIIVNAEGLAGIGSAIERGLESFKPPQDTFRPCFHVPKNPPHVVLRFSSFSFMAFGDDLDVTVETRLKWAVLCSFGSRSISAYGSSLHCAVGVNGMSGVGKSCALRGLANDDEIRTHFSDGIYWLVMGKDAAEADVVQQIARMIKRSGGLQRSKSVLEEKNIDDGVFEARKWFLGKRILLLIDDVWELNDLGSNIVQRLGSLADYNSGSRVAFTTRDLALAKQGEAIEFSVRKRDVSREILLSAAKLEEKDVASFRHFVDRLLALCGGLPMALSVAGSSIAMRLSIAVDLNLKEVWEEYIEELEKHRGEIVRKEVGNDGYGTLSSAFKASLSMLDEKAASKADLGISFEEMYRSLVVIERQGWIPLSILQILWKLDDEAVVKDILHSFVKSSMAERRDVIVNGRRIVGLGLHDLQLDFVESESRKYEGTRHWHEDIINTLRSKAIPVEQKVGHSGHKWALSGLSDDQYVRNNIGRHLIGAGLSEELRDLLHDPMWAEKRLRFKELLGLENDCKLFLDSLNEKGDKSTEANGAGWSTKMIAGAARLSTPYASLNRNEIWFQLHARLVGLRKESAILCDYTATIEHYAKKPWVKPISPCLSGPSILQSVLSCGGSVQDITVIEETERILACGIGDEGAFICIFEQGEVLHRIMLPGLNNVANASDPFNSQLYGTGSLSNMETAGYGSLEGWVCCASCSHCGKYAATGYENGQVQLWDATSGEAIKCPLPGHSGNVNCLAWSPDVKRVASGGDDGFVKIWSTETGKAVGEVFCGDSNGVWCLAFSPDGKRVASGGRDKRIRILDIEAGRILGPPLVGHNHTVRCVSWSTDGKRIASGGADETIRIWNVETGRAVLKILPAHRGAVHSVLWSRDGKRLASGGFDAVRIWNAETGDAIEKPLCGHTHIVHCLQWSNDEKRLLSASVDDTIRIWDMHTGTVVGETIEGHEDIVRHVEWSPDGKQVASVGWDNAVRIWNVKTGQPVIEALRCSGHIPVCVSWCADGKRVASGGLEGTMRLWCVETGKVIGDALRGHSRAVSSVAWSLDGRYIASGGVDKTVRVWSVETNQLLREPFCGHSNVVASLAWSPDGKRFASGGFDSMIRIWDVHGGRASETVIQGHTDSIISVAWSKDGNRIVSGSWDKTVRVWDGNTGEQVLPPLRGCGDVWLVAWSDDGARVIAGTENGRIEWELSDNLGFIPSAIGDGKTSRARCTLPISIRDSSLYLVQEDSCILATLETRDSAMLRYSPSGSEFVVFHGKHLSFFEIVE